jgi:hypothetical protein
MLAGARAHHTAESRTVDLGVKPVIHPFSSIASGLGKDNVDGVRAWLGWHCCGRQPRMDARLPRKRPVRQDYIPYRTTIKAV